MRAGTAGTSTGLIVFLVLLLTGWSDPSHFVPLVFTQLLHGWIVALQGRVGT